MTAIARPPAVVLFDLDGTLINSAADMVAAWTSLLVEAQLELGDVSELHGVPARSSIARLLGEQRADEIDHWVDFLLAAECAQTSQTHSLDGAFELLDQLDAARLPWAIVTSCQRPLAKARIEAAGLPLPKLLVTADDVTLGKPHPEPFLLGAELAGVEPTAAWVVEDAIAGIRAGKAAGATVVAVATTHPAEELSEAHVVVNDLRSLQGLLQSLLLN